MTPGDTIYAIKPLPESALAVDVGVSGLRKGKHLFFFEQYRGELAYDPEDPLALRMRLEIDASSVHCRSSTSQARENEEFARWARREALKAQAHPTITFTSTAVSPKPLRGFSVEGNLSVGGIARPIKANVVFGVPKNGRLQVDADATVPLSQFEIPSRTSLMGLIRTEDQVLLRALLWCTR